MNQILLTEEQNNKKNKNMEKKSKNNGPIEKNKIIVFFAIIIIVFGIALIGIFGFKALKGDEDNENKNTTNTITNTIDENTTNENNSNNSGLDVNNTHIDPPDLRDEPITLSLQKIETTGDDGEIEVKEVKIVIKSDVGIDNIKYAWNDEEENVIEENGSKSVNETLTVPTGNNSLYVKVTDVNGNSEEDTMNFSLSNEEHEPKIEVTPVDDGDVKKLKIVATAELPLKYIKYSWENSDEITIEPETSEDVRIEALIDFKVGKNKITIIASDINNNRKEVKKTYYGVNNPVIKVKKRGEKLYMNITHDVGIKKIEFNINGEEYIYDENTSGYDPNKKEIEYYFNLIDGENTVEITAYSMEETETTYRGRCKYNATN